MKYLRLLLFSLIAYCLYFQFSNVTQAIAEEEVDNVRFRWAFGAIVGPKEDQRLVAVTRDTTLKTGDQIKMLVELTKKCSVYVIYHGSNDEISLLFPYELGQFEKDYRIGEKYYIPSGNRWYELDDNVGTESIYLIASSKRLSTLEELLTKYYESTLGVKEKLRTEILVEIRNLKKQHRKFRVDAERPITIGGTMRGMKKDKGSIIFDIDSIADSVSTKDFYGKTFTIDHQ